MAVGSFFLVLGVPISANNDYKQANNSYLDIDAKRNLKIHLVTPPFSLLKGSEPL